MLSEKLGDRPEWMRIRAYREGRGPSGRRRSELMLQLRQRSYWFPLTPRVYENFRARIGKSRSKGLKYLQSYIRRYRQYKERWPSKRYVRVNRLVSGGFYNESELASRTGLSTALVEEIVRLAGEGRGSVEIVSLLVGVSLPQVESVLNLLHQEVGAISDGLLARLAAGESSVEEAVSALARSSERTSGKRLLGLLGREPMKSSTKGVKRISPPFRITGSSL